MLPHHQSTLDRAVEYFRADPTTRAVLLAGSIAKGVEKPTSDVDVMVVVTADEYNRRRSQSDYCKVIVELADYEGGYVDAKFVDEGFLRTAAQRASEPTRDSFSGVRSVWSTIEGLEEILRAIPVYPEQDREEKMRRFFSSALVQIFFLKEAEKREDPFLLHHAVVNMALHAGRLFLAYNRILFPSNKRFMERLAIAPDKPENLLQDLTSLVQKPSQQAGRDLMEKVKDFRDWGVDWGTALGLYIEDYEFNWLDNPPPLAES